MDVVVFAVTGDKDRTEVAGDFREEQSAIRTGKWSNSSSVMAEWGSVTHRVSLGLTFKHK
jgi:hypothetical protein